MSLRVWVSLALCLSLWGLAPSLADAQMTLSLDVPPGKWKALNLRNLPKGTVLAVDLQASGEIAVALVGAEDYKRFPAVAQPLFHSQAEKRLSFSVTLPATGSYFVVLDNRRAGEPRAITVRVRTTPGKRKDSLQEALGAFERNLSRIFVFEPFPIRIEQCGTPKALSGTFGIVLCQEYVRKLQEMLGDKASVADILPFTLLHEAGHVLLRQWKHPSSDLEEVADEFATVLMVMLGRKEQLRAKAGYFATNPSWEERHRLSAQREQNILRWADDPQLLRKWQPILVPRMQTAMLEQLRQRPTDWTDLALVEKELATRR